MTLTKVMTMRDDHYHSMYSLLFHSRALTLHSTFLYNSKSVVINKLLYIICLTNSKAKFHTPLVVTAVYLFSLSNILFSLLFNLIYKFVVFFLCSICYIRVYDCVYIYVCHFVETTCTVCH